METNKKCHNHRTKQTEITGCAPPGAEVRYNDPYFSTVGRGREYNLQMKCRVGNLTGPQLSIERRKPQPMFPFLAESGYTRSQYDEG
jgi:hypothetical protein